MKDCGVLGDNMCILGKEVNIGAKLVIVIIKMHVARSRSNANPNFFYRTQVYRRYAVSSCQRRFESCLGSRNVQSKLFDNGRCRHYIIIRTCKNVI